MATVSSAHFRRNLSEYLARAQREPITVTSRGVRRRAVLVSAEFFDRARLALEDAPYAPPPRTREQEILDDLMEFIQEL